MKLLATLLALVLSGEAVADSVTFRVVPATPETVWVQCTLIRGPWTTEGVAPISQAILRDPTMARLAVQSACDEALNHALEMKSRLIALPLEKPK